MTLSRLGALALVCAVLFGSVPGCDDDSEDSAFAGAAGSPKGGSTSRGGGSSRGGSAGDAPDSGGSAGDAPDSGGSGPGGESNLGGGGGNGGSAEAGSTNQAGGSGPNGSGGSDNPGVGWYCNLSDNSCVCVQEPLEVGDCGVFNCCYTYEGGAAGLACSCNDSTDPVCESLVASNEGTRVKFCPP